VSEQLAGDDEAPPPATEPVPPTAVFRLVEVVEATVTLPANHAVVELQEAEPPYRSLSLPIGLAEGVALSQALHKIPTPRPFTHELFTTVLERFALDIVAVRLVGRTGGTYQAELDLRGPSGRAVLDCRPSDAMVLALRQLVAAPVLVDDRLHATDDDVVPMGPA